MLVAFSSHVSEQVVRHCKEFGFDVIIENPLTQEKIYNQILNPRLNYRKDKELAKDSLSSGQQASSGKYSKISLGSIRKRSSASGSHKKSSSESSQSKSLKNRALNKDWCVRIPESINEMNDSHGEHMISVMDIGQSHPCNVHSISSGSRI